MRTINRIAVNAATKWLATGLQGLAGLVLVPFLLAQIGRAGYGVAALVGTIVSLGLLVDLGLRGALGRQLAEQVARKDDRRYNELASTAMVIFLGIGGMLAAACFTWAPELTHYFSGRKDLGLSGPMLQQAVWVVRWYASFNMLVTFIAPVYSASITSNNRFDLANYNAIIVNLVRVAALMLILSLTDWQLYGWAGGMFLTELALLVCYWVFAHRARPTLRIRPSLVTRTALRPLFGLGGYLFMFQLTDIISVRSDPLVLSRLLGIGSLALYNPGLALASMARPIVGTLAQQLHPLTTGYHVKGQREQMHAVLIRGTRLTWLMGIATSVVLLVFAEPIMRLWLGKPLGDDYIIAARVLQAWALVDLSVNSGGTQWSVLLGMQRLGFLVWTQLPFALANVAASILLVKYTNLGVLGVMVPTVVIQLIRRPILVVYVARVVKLPLWPYVRGAYLGPLMVLVLLTGFAGLLSHWFPPHNLPLLLGEAAATTLAWVVLSWYLGLGGEDRRDLLGMLTGLRRRLRRPRADQPVAAGKSSTDEV